jgi:DNA primase catalytic subunit
MVDFDNVLCDAYDLHDKDLMRLRDEINKEIQKREKKQELEAAEKVMKAIQDYLAAGYSIHIRGSAVYFAEGFEHDSDFITEVFAIHNDDGEIIIDVDECCLD